MKTAKAKTKKLNIDKLITCYLSVFKLSVFYALMTHKMRAKARIERNERNEKGKRVN